MDWQTAVDVLTAACAAYAAMGVYRLQRGQDYLTGRVPSVEAAHDAPGDAAGLHGR